MHRRASESKLSVKSAVEQSTIGNKAEEKKSTGVVKLNNKAEVITGDNSSSGNVNSVRQAKSMYNLSQSFAKQAIEEKTEPPEPQPAKLKTYSGKMLSVFELKNNSAVVIVYVRSHKVLFVRPSDPENTKKYGKLIEKVMELSKTAKVINNLPERDQLVLAPFDNGYYRAITLQALSADAPVKVAFIDFGNAHDVPLNEIKVSDDECLLGQRLVQRINLNSVTVEKTNAKIEQYLQDLSENATNLILKINGDANYELINATTKESVNDRINKLGGGEPIVFASVSLFFFIHKCHSVL